MAFTGRDKDRIDGRPVNTGVRSLIFTNRFIVFLCLFSFTCFGVQSQRALSDTTSQIRYKILFLGNSLTYSNNLPELVRKNAQQRGVILEVEMIAFPNYAIEDHWREGKVQKMIREQHYDFVILQQGPSSQDEGRRMLIDYGKKFGDLCRSHKAQLCYFTVWPSLNYYRTFDAVIKNHREAAAVNDAVLLPVGEVWKNHIDNTESLEYYGPDGFHPSLEGSEKAAEVIVATLFPRR